MIAVVGGRGFIGGAVVAALRDAGREVVVVSHDPRAVAPGTRHGDLRRPETLPAALAGAEVVVQSANFPTYPIEKPRKGHTFMAFDGEGAERLAAAARAAGVRRLVFVSGVGTRAEAPQPWFRALWRGESAILSSGLEAAVVRPAFVFGPRDRGLNAILRFARRSGFVPMVGDGGQLEQPVFVEDLAAVVRECAAPGGPQGVFEAGGPERMTLAEMLRTLLRIAGLRRPLVAVPRALARLGARVLERLPGPPLTLAAVDFICGSFVADNRRLEATFPLRLTPLEEGLRRYLA